MATEVSGPLGTVTVGGTEFEIRAPSALYLLRVIKFISGKLLTARRDLQFEWGFGKDKEAPDLTFVMLTLIEGLEEEDLVTLGTLLLAREDKETTKLVSESLTAEGGDYLLWLSKAFKFWMQGTKLGAVIENFYGAFGSLAEGMPEDLLEATQEAQKGASKSR